MNTDKCTKISLDDPELRPSFLNHFAGFVDKENARRAGILAFNNDMHFYMILNPAVSINRQGLGYHYLLTICATRSASAQTLLPT